tara:strand:- start:186 stop:617 length:432 start_codon:yes stop_codon:yes gene_type:complete
MIQTLIKDICDTNDWSYSYGSGEWLNLVDFKSEYRKNFSDRKIHCLLYTVEKSESYSEYGGLDSTTFSLSVLIGVSSDFNSGSYNEHFENYIQPLIESKVSILKDGLNNCDYAITGSISEKEFSNIFDNNLSGVILEISVKTV